MTASSNPTTGLNTTVKVAITSSAPRLVLSPVDTGHLTQYQITAQAEAIDGTVQNGVPLYYDIVAGFECASVSSTGLLVAEEPGQVVVRVSASTFNAHPGAFTPSGTPATGIVSQEQVIQIVEGNTVSDFYFVIASLGSNQYQISQHAEDNVTFTGGTVTYVLGPPNSPAATVLGAITGGSGILNFSSSSPFIVTGTWALGGVVQTFHQVWSNWGGGAFPVMSVRASKGGFGVSGYSSASSGQPYTG